MATAAAIGSMKGRRCSRRARAAGADGVTVTKSEDFAGALEAAIASNRPCLIDVHVDAEVKPPSTGTWQLPPTPHTEPAFGKPYVT